MSLDEGSVVFPGDTLTALKTVKGEVVIGPGVRRNDEKPNTLYVTKPGTLSFKSPNVYWVEGKAKRYVPKKGDAIVGIIAKKGGDTLKVDIGGSELAALSTLAFEGATKKQKPDVQVGDALYAKVLSAHREMEPELVCVDSYGKAGKLGPLSNDGFILNVRPYLCYRLLNVENPLLRTLGKKFPFEIAIGMNGKIWINAKSPKNVFKLVQALEAFEKQSDKEIVELCRQY